MATRQGVFDMRFITSRTNHPPYQQGGNFDLGACEQTTCEWNYTAAQAGLNHVKCRACGAETIVHASGRGTIKMACRLSSDVQAAISPVATPLRRF